MKYLYLNFRDEFHRIEISRIVYFESDGNYTKVAFANNRIVEISMNLTQMQTVLNEQLKEKSIRFARIGKRHIVNLNYVSQIAIARQILVLSDMENFEFKLNISKDALKNLREIFVANNKTKEEVNN